MSKEYQQCCYYLEDLFAKQLRPIFSSLDLQQKLYIFSKISKSGSIIHSLKLPTEIVVPSDSDRAVVRQLSMKIFGDQSVENEVVSLVACLVEYRKRVGDLSNHNTCLVIKTDDLKRASKALENKISNLRQRSCDKLLDHLIKPKMSEYSNDDRQLILKQNKLRNRWTHVLNSSSELESELKALIKRKKKIDDELSFRRGGAPKDYNLKMFFFEILALNEKYNFKNLENLKDHKIKVFDQSQIKINYGTSDTYKFSLAKLVLNILTMSGITKTESVIQYHLSHYQLDYEFLFFSVEGDTSFIDNKKLEDL